MTPLGTRLFRLHLGQLIVGDTFDDFLSRFEDAKEFGRRFVRFALDWRRNKRTMGPGDISESALVRGTVVRTAPRRFGREI